MNVNLGNIYNVDVKSAVNGDAISGVQSAIASEYGIDTAHYAKIVKCDMRSATAFTVRFNSENELTAVLLPSGEYGVTYMGGIDQILFSKSTTLTWFQVEWGYAGITD